MVSDLNFFAKKLCKIAAAQKVFYGLFSSHLFTPFNGPFAHTSRSSMSKMFRYLESLGKSNGKNWSQIWKLVLIKGVKSPRKKKLVFGRILPYWAGFFCYQCFSLSLTGFVLPLPEVQHPNFLDFRNPWGKVMVRSGLRFENSCS